MEEEAIGKMGEEEKVKKMGEKQKREGKAGVITGERLELYSLQCLFYFFRIQSKEFFTFPSSSIQIKVLTTPKANCIRHFCEIRIIFCFYHLIYFSLRL